MLEKQFLGTRSEEKYIACYERSRFSMRSCVYLKNFNFINTLGVSCGARYLFTEVFDIIRISCAIANSQHRQHEIARSNMTETKTAYY